MSISTRDITKEHITHLEPAPLPEPCELLQVRVGKVKTLGNEVSGIFKQKQEGPLYVGPHGLEGDEHVYYTHGGVDRGLNQYASSHYADWRCEASPKPELFDFGGFGENLVGTNMTEENVCIGDVFRIGSEVTVQVSEPRNPCYKLCIRFQWARALKRVHRTARPGWNFRVLKTGYIQQGDFMVLLERPNPVWSVLNVKRVIQGKTVPLPLVQELTELHVLTEMVRDLARKRLETTHKTYKLVDAQYVTARVKQLTFALNEPITIRQPEFKSFSFAQLEFGTQPLQFTRSYSIVCGDQNTFSLGVALDDHSRGGSAYLHKQMEIGDEIRMAPGSSAKAVEDEEQCIKEDCVTNRIVIIGGIGVTAFLPITQKWEADGKPYRIHYAVRSLEEAAYVNRFAPEKTTVYAKSRGERLQIDAVIPEPDAKTGTYKNKIYCCGPSALMDACQARTTQLGYPEHMLHFESFGTAAGGPRGDPFEANVIDIDSGQSANLAVPADKTLLQALREAGFDMTFCCETGACGACKVNFCNGKVLHRGTGLQKWEVSSMMLSCVDRGIGKIQVELD